MPSVLGLRRLRLNSNCNSRLSFYNSLVISDCDDGVPLTLCTRVLVSVPFDPANLLAL